MDLRIKLLQSKAIDNIYWRQIEINFISKAFDTDLADLITQATNQLAYKIGLSSDRNFHNCVRFSFPEKQCLATLSKQQRSYHWQGPSLSHPSSIFAVENSSGFFENKLQLCIGLIWKHLPAVKTFTYRQKQQLY